MSFNLKDLRIGVIGLGYVGLPLAVEFGKKYPTVGFDIKPGRIAALEAGNDTTLEVDREELDAATRLSYTSDPEALRRCNFFIDVPGPNDLCAEGDFYNHNYAFQRGETIVARSTKEPTSQGFGVDIPGNEDPVLLLASAIVIDLVTRDSGSRGSLFN